ncbi:Gamma-interferon-inducible-lysosomal thiol reductase [Nibea albiflora]|uniref:Gamma-interferon-inducible-lysosomal thiol reductase n=1 Tax=Nibea albiflora TaxID=240163 RepID=A0ACB7ELP5_NIBAL|nr:Gamma-interferon-inducible-lysosomal thiol reductase [Nibea albiflora]
MGLIIGGGGAAPVIYAQCLCGAFSSSSNMKLSVLFVVFLLLCVHRRSSGSHPRPSCRYPPSQWCRSLEIAIECRVQKQCMEVNAIRANQSVPPVSVTLYYESLCPACRVFISQQLFPTWTMLQDIMTVTLVPYGNAKACIIHLTGHSAFQIINCMESATDVLNAAQPCLQLYTRSVSWSTVESCVKGDLGYQLMHANAAMTRALSPAHTHVPWVTFNGGVKPPACTGAAVRLNRGFC